MLSKLIVNSYRLFIEVALWLTLFGFIIGGWAATQNIPNMGGGAVGAGIGVFAWLIVAVVLFGGFLVLGDIRERVKSIETAN